MLNRLLTLVIVIVPALVLGLSAAPSGPSW